MGNASVIDPKKLETTDLAKATQTLSWFIITSVCQSESRM